MGEKAGVGVAMWIVVGVGRHRPALGTCTLSSTVFSWQSRWSSPAVRSYLLPKALPGPSQDSAPCPAVLSEPFLMFVWCLCASHDLTLRGSPQRQMSRVRISASVVFLPNDIDGEGTASQVQST